MPDTLLTFVHISDTHISPDPAFTALDFPFTVQQAALALVRELQNLPVKPDFVLHTGDVVYDPDPAAYTTARDILSQIPYPVYYLAGNHDEPEALQRFLLGQDEIISPFDYTFDVNGVQIVCVDSNGPAVFPAGFVTQPQLECLEEVCSTQDDRPLVVAVHHNVLPVNVPWLDVHMRITNGEDFHAALLPARHRLRGVFFGHVHQNLSMCRDGILYSSVLSSWAQLHAWPGQTETVVDTDAEPGFNLVTLTHNQTYIRHCRYAVS